MVPNYQVEYQLNGVPSSFEFYLFVNPLGMRCYHSEQELIRSINMINSKVDVNILTYHNHEAIYHFLEQININHANLAQRNLYYNIVYKAAVAYKAASLQGKKLGRQFLIRLQELFNHNTEDFSEEMFSDIAKEIGLDLQIFLEDLNSDFVRQLFLKDQKIAREMQVQQTPALVIFQNQSEHDGILIREDITREVILEELDNIVQRYYLSRKEKPRAKAKLSIIHKSEETRDTSQEKFY